MPSPALQARLADVATPEGLLKSLSTLVIVWVIFHLLKALYNVSPFHPLYHIPGPKLAAASYLNEFYHDVVLHGRYTHEIRDMHKRYGPIVRINPNEVHCNDPGFVDEIYAVGGRKRDKPIHQVNMTVIRHSGFGTVDHDLHRTRRSSVAKFFSRGMIAGLEGDITAMTQKMCDKILAQGAAGAPFDVAVACSNLTTDVISGYCFGETFGLLDRPGWKPNFRDPTMATLRYMFMFRFWPFLKSLTKVGVWFVDMLPEETALLVRTMQIDIPDKVKKAIDDWHAGIVYERPTIVGAIMESDLSAEEKKPERVADDALAVVGAGTETTAWALAVMTYHLKTRPEVLDKLTREIQEVVHDSRRLPSWTVLEKLPYLSAVIQEGLRLSLGVSGRTARVPTEESLLYRGKWQGNEICYNLPKGYAIGMTSAITHYDEAVFEDPMKFNPDRWLRPEQKKALDSGMLMFSKGSRACLGMNLALCELHLALAALTLRVLPHIQLYETTEEDIRYDYDMLIPMPKVGTNGVRAILVTG
ncbi:hypothetical protein E8E14_012819 [Neopestalotiopsis sp. 37M]|nr:hypothetical protein E8E14_012819 [Neopestalotiopsis sp. 37M]